MGKIPLPAYLTSLCRVQHVFWVFGRREFGGGDVFPVPEET